MRRSKNNSMHSESLAEIESQLTISEKYELEWIELCTDLSQSENVRSLRKIGLQDGFKSSKFRSLCWSLCLRILRDDSSSWLEQRRSQRTKYAEMKEQFTHNPYKNGVSEENGTKIVEDDPLSQNEESLWHQHFCDQELTKLIRQDVTRTFPAVDFFRDPKIQDTMASILFCYARANPNICYRQGMHEILAPILFVVRQDHLNMLNIKQLNNSINHTLYEVLDPKYFEEDSYSLFSAIMEHMETYYKINGVVPTASGELPPVQTVKDVNSPLDELDKHVNWMRANVLAKSDPDLESHLVRMEIPLSIIGIRWYRVLFGREFPFSDLLLLWDAVFSDQFELIKFIPAAMLISVRKNILSSDFVGVYQCLMNYQDVVDPKRLSDVRKYSLYLKDSTRFKKPEGFFVNVARKKPTQSSFQRLNSKAGSSSRPRANSLQKLTSKSLIAIKKPIDFQQAPHDLGVTEGFAEDDPTVLNLELQHMTNLMNISRLKLVHYVKILRENLESRNPKVNQCLDGLEELAALMRMQGAPEEDIPPISVTPPVESALEANEQQSELPLKFQTLPRRTKMTDREAKTEFVKTLKRATDCDSTQRSRENGEILEYKATENDIKKLEEPYYEIPDENQSNRIAKKLLGNRKEVELKEIRVGEVAMDEIRQKYVPNPNPQRERLDS